jgi:uncharacterized membrane protein YfcA
MIIWFGISASGHADNLNKGVWLIAGYIIGLVSAIVGIGGGTMTTPFLTYNKVDIKNAIATSAAVSNKGILSSCPTVVLMIFLTKSLPNYNAIATSAAVGMPIAIAGSVGFIIIGTGVEGTTGGLGFIHIKALLSIVMTSIFFAPLGAKAAHRSTDAKPDNHCHHYFKDCK